MIQFEETAAGFLARGWDDLPEETRAALRADADALGYFGLLCAVAGEEPAIQPEVRDEVVGPLVRDLRDALGQEEGDLPALITAFRAARGERAAGLLARTIARVVYEVYDLQAHRLVQENVLGAFDLLAFGGPGHDARELARRVCRISRHSARTVLGHLDAQLEFVAKLGAQTSSLEEPDQYEIDRRLRDYAPRIFAQRLPSMTRRLLHEEARFRFAFVLWARLRGVVLSRGALLAISDLIVPEKPEKLVEALVARAGARATLRRADAEQPHARLLEQVFVERPL